MKATIIKKTPLPGIHSASGIEVLGDRLYIVGDDASWLYVLDKAWKPAGRVRLFDTSSPAGERIPKLQKPDLEALTVISLEGQPYLLAVGSGSQANRQDAFLINPATGAVQRHSLAPLYDHLRTLTGVVGQRLLNIEGLAVADGVVIFLQRGNVSGTNALVAYALDPFTAWLTENGPLPAPQVRSFVLPTVEGYTAGFSGAAPIPSRRRSLLFTASVEATDDEILDGDMLGSFAGILDLDDPADTPRRCAPILYDNQAYPGKVESICVREETQDGLSALAVTDADGGASELLLLDIAW